MNSRQAARRIMERYYGEPEFRDAMVASAQARRAEKLGLGSLKITVAYLGDRDGWMCGICGQLVTRTEASVDHIVPLSRGGTHTLDNVQVAHRFCNYSKGNRGSGEQLLLVG